MTTKTASHQSPALLTAVIGAYIVLAGMAVLSIMKFVSAATQTATPETLGIMVLTPILFIVTVALTFFVRDSHKRNS